jgi:hypothetical protein
MRAWMRFAGWSMGCLALGALSGCGDRDGSIKAALALAEVNYPGQLELQDAQLQKDHYDIVLAIKGDPVTRIRFGVDRDPADCTPASPCEARLQRAYANGVAAGIKLKALDQGFRQCGVPVLGLNSGTITTAFTALIELDLGAEAQQAGLDRLTPCIAAFRQALPAASSPQLQSLALRILLPSGNAPAVAPSPLTFEARVSGKRQDGVSYLLGLEADDVRADSADLRLYPHYLSASGLDRKLAEIAQGVLSEDADGGHVPEYPLTWSLQLDPRRLDVIHTYVLACSVHKAGEGPCRTDIAVRMRYDMTQASASDLAVVRGIRDERGSVTLPALPGRHRS